MYKIKLRITRITQIRHFEDGQRSRKHVDGEIQEKFEIYSISGKLI